LLKNSWRKNAQPRLGVDAAVGFPAFGAVVG
jgi:hypothetical protein